MVLGGALGDGLPALDGVSVDPGAVLWANPLKPSTWLAYLQKMAQLLQQQQKPAPVQQTPPWSPRDAGVGIDKGKAPTGGINGTLPGLTNGAANGLLAWAGNTTLAQQQQQQEDQEADDKQYQEQQQLAQQLQLAQQQQQQQLLQEIEVRWPLWWLGWSGHGGAGMQCVQHLPAHAAVGGHNVIAPRPPHLLQDKLKQIQAAQQQAVSGTNNV